MLAAGRRTHLAALGARAAREAVWFGSFALLAATVLGAVSVAAKLAICLAGGYSVLLRYAVTSWRTVAVLPAAVLLAAVWDRTPHGPSFRELRRDAARWAAGVGVVAVVLAARLPHLSVDDYGWNVSPASGRFWIDRGHPYRPPAFVTTNAHGFRDREWSAAPAAGVARVVTVGDSYVFGVGVPEEDGTLARSLERALVEQRAGGRWEVLNAGHPGWGLITYFEVARRLVRELRPRVVVVGSNGWSDWDVLEEGQLLARLGPAAYRLLSALGVTDDLRQASLRRSFDANREAIEHGRAKDHERFAAALDALLRDAAAANVEVVVWEYYDPLPFFDAYEGSPRFHRAGWPSGFPRGWEGWGNDPVLAIPVDRHPTAEGNRLVAEALARTISGAVAGARTAQGGAP